MELVGRVRDASCRREPHHAIAVARADADARVRKHRNAAFEIETMTVIGSIADALVEEAAVLHRQPWKGETRQAVGLDALAREYIDPFVEVERLERRGPGGAHERRGLVQTFVTDLERSSRQAITD